MGDCLSTQGNLGSFRPVVNYSNACTTRVGWAGGNSGQWKVCSCWSEGLLKKLELIKRRWKTIFFKCEISNKWSFLVNILDMLLQLFWISKALRVSPQSDLLIVVFELYISFYWIFCLLNFLWEMFHFWVRWRFVCFTIEIQEILFLYILSLCSYLHRTLELFGLSEPFCHLKYPSLGRQL